MSERAFAMQRPHYEVDWQEIVDERLGEPVESTRGRLRFVAALFALALAAIFGRAVQLEWSEGETFRSLAAKPLERTVTPAAPRGAILARDGTPLAVDRTARSLAIEFHYLANPPQAAWLRRQARVRLPRAERRASERVAAMEEQIRSELAAWHQELARICKLSDSAWQARTERIQRRVTVLAERVNARRLEIFQQQNNVLAPPGELTLATVLAGLFTPPDRLPPPPVVLVEQTAYHRVVDDLTPEMVLAIEGIAARRPGAKIVEYSRRSYPQTTLAAHLVGHIGPRGGLESTVLPPTANQAADLPVGLMGIERRFEDTLRCECGSETRFTDHRGKLLATEVHRASVPGRDTVLTIDAELELAAEQLLDRALKRRSRQTLDAAPHGAAIVVLDVHSGEILAAASAPRFDPNWYVTGEPRIEELLHDSARPMFDRATKMALPPGSVFKPLTALALLERGVIDAQTPFACQGYLEDPDRLRCQIFRQQGIGHGEVTLADALAQSCNTYFFHHVRQLGAAPLVAWSSRFGLGQRIELELPDVAMGNLPTPSDLRQTSQTQAMAVGQGTLTTTPLEIARIYAAIANGGHLVVPRLTRDAIDRAPSRAAGLAQAVSSQSTRIVGLSERSLAAVREGLERVVADPNGTAYATVRLPSLAIAGKTGTAETGGEQADHAWFAGYAPAEAPRVAFVVVLEHGGSGATAAGALAKSLVQRMQQLGYFGASTAQAIPPGKG